MQSDQDLASLAVDLVSAGSHFARAVFQATGTELSYVSLRVLATLEREPGLRVGELARREGITQPSMSQAIKRLVDDGLVDRAPAPDDARASELTVTDAGRRVVRDYRDASARQVVPMFRDLSPGDVETLQSAAALLPKLTEQLRDRKGGRE